MENQPKMNVNVNEAQDMKCEECDNELFESVFRIKKLSALISPTGKTSVIPVQLLACTKCGVVLNNLT